MGGMCVGAPKLATKVNVVKCEGLREKDKQAGGESGYYMADFIICTGYYMVDFILHACINLNGHYSLCEQPCSPT